jgi:hypothetical protein
MTVLNAPKSFFIFLPLLGFFLFSTHTIPSLKLIITDILPRFSLLHKHQICDTEFDSCRLTTLGSGVEYANQV